MVARSLLCELGALLAAVPVVSLVHELGHALAAPLAGYRVSSFGLGRGPALVRFRTRRGAVVYLGRWPLPGGTCVAIPLQPDPGRRWLHQAGGLAAQALLAALLLPLAGRFEALDVAWRFNLLVLATNLLPWRIGGVASDGWQLLAERFEPGRAGAILARGAELRRVLRLEERVGSRLGTAWARLVLAWIAVLLGRPEEAAPVLEHEWDIHDPHLDGLRSYVLAEWHRACGRSLAAVAACRDLRARWRTELPEAAADLASLAEARAWVELGEAGLARQALARVAGASGAAGDEAAVVRLEATLLDGEADEIELCARRVASRPRAPLLDAPQAARALWSASAALLAGGRSQAAARVRRAARSLGAALLVTAEPGDRVDLARRLGEVAGVRSIQDSARP